MPNTIMLGSRDLSSSQRFQFAQVIVPYLLYIIQTCLVISNMYLMRNYIETRPRRGMAVFLEVTTILAGHSLALTYSDRLLPILLHYATLLPS